MSKPSEHVPMEVRHQADRNAIRNRKKRVQDTKHIKSISETIMDDAKEKVLVDNAIYRKERL